MRLLEDGQGFKQCVETREADLAHQERGATAFACESVTFLATTAMPGSNEWAFTPTVTHCSPNTTSNWTTAGQWKGISVKINAGVEAEANLEIPANGFEFEPTVAAGGEAGCKVKARASTIGEAKDYFNRSPFSPPSFWFVPVAQINKVKIEAKNGAANCFTGQTEVPIVYGFNLYNRTTGATEGIHVN